MSNNYKIIIKDKPIGSDQIDQFKDFDALLKQHQQITSQAKLGGRVIGMKKWISSAAAIFLGGIACVAAWYFATPNTDYLTLNDTYFKHSTVKESLSVSDIPSAEKAVFILNKGENSIEVQGMTFVIPEQAFKNQDSNEGIQLEISIYNNAQSIFAGGYHTKLNDESILINNTIIDIVASKDNSNLLNDKSLTIETDISFNGLYAVNKNRWDFLSEGQEKSITYTTERKNINVEKALADFRSTLTLPIRPEAPAAYNEDNMTVVLPSEEKIYGQQVRFWEVLDGTASSFFDEQHTDYTIHRAGSNFVLNVTQEDGAIKSIRTRPVLQNSAYESALAQYKVDLAAYEQSLEAYDNALTQKEQSLKKQAAENTEQHTKHFKSYAINVGSINFAEEKKIDSYEEVELNTVIPQGEDSYVVIFIDDAIIKQPFETQIQVPLVKGTKERKVYVFDNNTLVAG